MAQLFGNKPFRKIEDEGFPSFSLHQSYTTEKDGFQKHFSD